MNKLGLGHGFVLLVLGACCVFFSGCGTINDRPGEEELGLALAGMAGSDGVSFEGSAMLLHEDKGIPESLLYYGGDVEDHNKIKLYTLLPDKELSKASEGGAVKGLENNEPEVFSSRLEKKDGEWQPLSEASPDQEGNPLPGLNPLRLLEELEKMDDKTVTEEKGAARGTRVLRIELTPSEARKQLSAELEREMSALRPAGGTGGTEKAKNTNPQEKSALEALWKKNNDELHRKLEQVNVTAIYHLTVDKKQNLPRSLAWTRTVTDPDGSAEASGETYVMQVDFYGYR